MERFYRRLQSSVPAGEPILATLDHTFYLDGRRNHIYTFDHPGVIGPRGGPPAFQGPEAFASYLSSVGIRYLAYVYGPSSPEFKRALWEGKRIEGKQGFWLQTQARFELDFFDTVTALAAAANPYFTKATCACSICGRRRRRSAVIAARAAHAPVSSSPTRTAVSSAHRGRAGQSRRVGMARSRTSCAAPTPPAVAVVLQHRRLDIGERVQIGAYGHDDLAASSSEYPIPPARNCWSRCRFPSRRPT